MNLVLWTCWCRCIRALKEVWTPIPLVAIQWVSEDAIKLCLFSCTLQDKALFSTLLQGSITSWEQSITSWEQLRATFLDWFYLVDYGDKLQNDLLSFCQMESENLYDAQDPFNELMWKCLSHGLEQREQAKLFYKSLSSKYQRMLSYAALGRFLKNNAFEMFDII